MGLVEDWTHHHLIFSNPGTFDEAVKNGTPEKWYAITNDPRYQLQQLQRSATQRAAAAAPDFAARMAILSAPTVGSDVVPKQHPAPKTPIKKDWSAGLGSGTAASLTCSVGTLNSSSISGTSTLTVDGVTFDASAPVAEVATISVPSSTYCIPPGAGVSVGTGPTSVTTNGTVPTGGHIVVTATATSGATTTIGGVVYTWETSVTAAGCGTTLNCVLVNTTAGSAAQRRDDTAEALYRAINNTGANSCTNTGAANPCYALATGQGVNAEVTASYTANTNTVTFATWNCAGVAALYDPTTTGVTGLTITDPTGGTNGTTSGSNFAIPNPASNATLSSNINTAIGNSGAAGFTKSYISPTITLTASTPGTTGITDSLVGSPTGITVAVTTAGSNGTTSGTSTPPTFAYWSGNTYASSSAVATNIATAVNANATTSGAITATANSPASGDVLFTAKSAGTGGNSIAVSEGSFSAFTGTGNLSGGTTATVQPSMFPAKYGASLTTASCANDFVVYPTGQAGGATAANIIAYSNLYTTGCTGTVPSVYWAYNTGTGYSVTTPPIISNNATGSKVAFIQSNGSAAELVVVEWASSASESLSSPGVPTTVASITSCSTPPCMTVTPLSHNVTYSGPFYDNLPDDALYVGDDSGYLEKFTGVFYGAISGPTTVQLNSVPYAIASPVFDGVSGCVFVGDTEGYLYSVDSGSSTTTSVCKSGTYKLFGHSELLGGGAANEGIFDAPLVDSSAQTVYVFIADSAAIGSCSAGQNCVAQFTTSTITSGSTTAAPAGAEPLGTGGAGYNLYAGTFDNVYYSSANATGSLYAVGNTGATTGATLYRVPISTSTMSASVSAVAGLNSTEHPWPSPATEFCNNGTSACAVTTGGTCGAGVTCTSSGTDYVFFSVNRGTPTGCTNAAGDGCVLSYNISNPSSVALSGSGLNVTTPGTNGCWATGGFVIDNSATATTGAQQIYFINLNGAAAGGGAGGAVPASSNCTAGAGPTIDATQAAQASP